MALSDTLKALSEQSDADATLEARTSDLIALWQKSIDDLHVRIGRWLAPHVASDFVRLEVGEIELNEERFGRYSAATLTIRAGSHVVRVQPIALAIIGGRGRVDMFRQGRSARDERVLLIRNNDMEQADWSIRTPAREAAGVHQVEPLTKESFETALDGLLR